MRFPAMIAATALGLATSCFAAETGDGAAGGVTDGILARMPDGMAMPPEILETMRWLESQGAVMRWGDDGARALHIYPGTDGLEPRFSMVHFLAPEDYQFDYPGLPPDQVRARLFPFIRTADDGSWAALWLDDAGQQRIVHMGGDSGWFGTMVKDSVDLLRFLAIGYSDPAFYNGDALSPHDEWLIGNGYEDIPKAELVDEGIWEPPIPPEAFAGFVAERFGRPIPENGSGLVSPGYGDGDDFARWLTEISG